MNTRRKFLINGSLAATALLTSKPFTSIANNLSPLTGFSTNNNCLILAHTGSTLTTGNKQVLQQITTLRNNTPNLMMLHAGDKVPALQPFYDASLHSGENYSVAANDYRIVYKGNIKTGVISTGNKSTTAESINALAIYLKEEKNCHLVVCLSQLGYKLTNALDDLALAGSSTHVDIIIGGHVENFCKHTVIARNRNKEEVIINYATTEALAERKIEISFNKQGKKNQVAFTKTC